MTYSYPDHPVIQTIELLPGDYDWRTDDSSSAVVIHYRDGHQATWRSAHMISYADPVPDAAGERIYCSSLRRGIFCFEAATGRILWQNRRRAMRLVVNPDQTIACRYVGKLFLLSPDGEVRKEIRNISSNQILYAGEYLFFLYYQGKYQLLSSQTLEAVHTFPRSALPDALHIRFARKIGSSLEVELFPQGSDPEIFRLPLPAPLP